jgi:hypothetical protein
MGLLSVHCMFLYSLFTVFMQDVYMTLLASTIISLSILHSNRNHFDCITSYKGEFEQVWS